VNNRIFLPLFFALLGVTLLGAVGWRILAYQRGDVHATINSEGRLDPAQADGQDRRIAGTDAQQAMPTDGGAEVVANRTAVTPASVQNGMQSRAPMSLREQRFAEALAAAQKASAEQPQKIAVRRPEAAAPIVAPPTKPVEKPCILTRIGNAISNAFNSNSTANAAPQPQQQQNNPPKHDPAKEKDQGDKPKEKDPTSDTTPPQLQSAIFQPPAIQDGQETTLIVTAIDDLSGIRNISGSVASPTGKALQGFAAQRETPDSSRYLARIAVPKDAEQGVWRVNFLSLTDNAGNTTNINGQMAAGAYSFTVTSARPDNTPPTLRAVYVEKRSMSGGEKNTVFVQATDDKSGVAIISGVFQSPAKTARIGFGCRNTGPDQFECDLVAPSPVDCGDWQLEQIQMQDKAQNNITVRSDNPIVAAVKINMLSDHCDNTPPVVENLVLDPQDVSNAADSVVTATATVTDDTGVQSVSGQLAGPMPDKGGQPPRIFFAFQKTDDPQIWSAKINIPKFAAKGTWTVVWLMPMDKSNNTRTYSQTDPVLANAKITVR